MPADAVQVPSSLAVSVCPNCAYSLAGLAAEGICPECGRAYDQTEVVLYGWAHGSFEDLSNAKPSRMIWVVLCSLFYIILQMGMTFSLPPLYVIIAWVFLPAVYLLFLRRNIGHPGLVQVRLNQRGCVQYDDLAGTPVLSEIVRSHGWLIGLAAAMAVLVAWHFGWVGAFGFWFWFSVALGVAGFSWNPCRQFREAIRGIRDGSIADANAAFRKPTPWEKTVDITLRRAMKGNFLLKIVGSANLFDNIVVDAEIQRTEPQAAALDELMKHWMALAKSHASPL